MRSCGIVYSLTWNNTNALTTIQAPTGASTNFSYCSLTQPSGSAPSCSDGSSATPYQPENETDAQNNVTTFTYDTSGNLSTVQDANHNTACEAHQGDPSGTCGATASVDCKAKPGQICWEETPAGNKTSFSYDGKGNLVKITPPSPLKPTTITEDLLSRPCIVTDGDGQTATYSYDGLDRITQLLFGANSSCTSPSPSCTPASGNCITYSYDQAGNLKTRVDSTGTTTWSYDNQNRPKQENLPSLGNTQVQYDPAGNLQWYQDQFGQVVYGYDPANNLTSGASH
jgi:YD repeat-containing protein